MKPGGNIPRMSVVIPTLGRPILIKTLESLSRSEGFESMEIVVAGRVLEKSVLDALNKMTERFPSIIHLPVSFTSGDSSEKKNAGFRASHADIVAFLDDDVVVAKDWPLRMLETFNDPTVGLVSGPSLVPEDISPLAHLAGVALASKAAGYVSGRYLQGHPEPRRITWSRIIGCNMAYRRRVLEEIGAFDPTFWPGEEMIASFRAMKNGHVLMFNPQAYVYHYPRESLSRFWKQIHGYGATRIRLLRGGCDFEPTTLVPGVWVLSLLVLGVGALFSKIFLWLLMLDLVLYFFADLWITLSKFRETRRRIDLLLIFLVPVLHLSYGIAEWAELFRPNKDLSEKSASVR
jgi:cellulose synthase/poly-beta-1,6-N-acetylglucosamine synthase-like glycosyltransferase